MIRAVVVCMLALAGTAGVAAIAPRAAHADDVATRTAKRHFERGEKLFALGQFGDALEEYKKAYDAKPLPGFLYNIGQCYRNLDDFEQAIFSYKKYLQLKPEAANRDQVEKLIDDLEQKKAAADAEREAKEQQAQQDRDRAAQPTGDGGGGDHATRVTRQATPQARSSPFYTKWWFWTGVVVVGAGAGVGIFEATHGAPPSDLGTVPFH